MRSLSCAAILIVACANPAPPPSDGSAPEATYYREPHRPQIHFSPATAWMNDPNGLFYLDGVYHLYYQHYPDSIVWGPMHWGHATSTDLVHWNHHTIAIRPDEHGYIFSGSAIVDHRDVSGFGDSLTAKPDATPPVVALFTYHDPERERAGRDDVQSQGTAYSLDGGYTFRSPARPVVMPNEGDGRDWRDPKVTYDPARGRYVMALAAGDRVKLYTSPNLRDWRFASDVGPGVGSPGRLWECPDLFPIRVTRPDGSAGEERWVLIVSVQNEAPAGGTGTSYLVGDFDGTRFRPLPGGGGDAPLWVDYGADDYALVTFDNAPGPPTERPAIGWMSNWQYAQAVPTQTWRSAMTLPRVLSLQETPDGPRLRQRLPDALDELRDTRARLRAAPDGADVLTALNQPDPTAPLDIVVDHGGSGDVSQSFELRLASAAGDTVRVGYDATADGYYVDRSGLVDTEFSADFAARHTVPRAGFAEASPVRVVIDASSVEVFADGGLTVMTDLYFLSSPRTGLALVGGPKVAAEAHVLHRAVPIERP